MEIHPNASLVMKSISEAALRVRFGVNIVAIQRGRKAIVTPMPEELLLPRDELILLGTDEQVGRMKVELEEPTEFSESFEITSHYEVKQTRISKESTFAGKTIRQSGIRERFHAMVVGIERGGKRDINPDSDLELVEGDNLWIAGEREKLGQLFSLINPLINSPFETKGEP